VRPAPGRLEVQARLPQPAKTLTCTRTTPGSSARHSCRTWCESTRRNTEHPSNGTTAGPDLSVAPSAPRTMPAEAPTAVPPNLSLAPGAGRTMPPSPPASPGASVDLSLEPSAPRSIPGGPSTSSASQPPLTASGLPHGSYGSRRYPEPAGNEDRFRAGSWRLTRGRASQSRRDPARVGIQQARSSALQGDG